MGVGVEPPGVTRDATLDSFLDAADESEQGQAESEQRKAESEQGETEREDEASEESADSGESRVDEEAFAPTTDWHAEGRECEQCGAVVERRWRQDGAMVCPPCKDWQVA